MCKDNTKRGKGSNEPQEVIVSPVRPLKQLTNSIATSGITTSRQAEDFREGQQFTVVDSTGIYSYTPPDGYIMRVDRISLEPYNTVTGTEFQLNASLGTIIVAAARIDWRYSDAVTLCKYLEGQYINNIELIDYATISYQFTLIKI